ncbi:MAG: hypothetical protein Q4F72_12965, partial [Desulfovibrionaceae bacterium]|nr:hypothetical protein [Desulfovibrionaceae bacterium]
ADRALPDPRLAARLARLARAVFDAQDGLLLVGRLGGGLPREHCRLEWLVLEELSRILRVQVFASAADGTVYEEACRTWTGQKDLCLAHLDPGITATPVLLWSGRHFDAGLDDPRRGERAHRAPGAGAGAGETKAADESLLPQEPYLWVAAGEARAARGLDDAGAAALLGAALRPCGDEAVPAKARRTRVPRQRTGPLITRLVLRGLGGLPGLELPEMRRFSFLDGADAAARDALLDGLLLLSLSRHPEAALMLPAVRGLPATMENALAILRDLARNAPGGPAAAGADSAPGFFATALAGPDGAVSDLVTEVLEGWRLERLPASLPTAGQGSCTLIFREQRHLMRVLLDLSGETPAAGWSVSRVTPFALRVIHVDASKPMDAGLKALLKTLHGEELDALACAMLPLARNARRPDPAGLALTLSISPGMLPISDAPVEARRRAAQLVAGVLAARGGILAADHVGRDLPPDFVGPLWRVLENLAGRMQVQIVAVMDDPALYEAARNGAASRGDFCLLAPRVPGTAATPETA